ncbi:MAG: type II toxin-antitoxin system VapC family toxin [Burkholderiaceae bacterium]
MTYVDTSALVALLVNETRSDEVAAWYAQAQGELVCATWAITEFGSALGLKQRTGQLTASNADEAWKRFERLVANDLDIIVLETSDFHRAALLSRDSSTGVRAGDALHLACAQRVRAESLLTLDAVMARAASLVGLSIVRLRTSTD